MCFLISRAPHIRQLPGSPHPGRSEVACHSVMRPCCSIPREVRARFWVCAKARSREGYCLPSPPLLSGVHRPGPSSIHWIPSLPFFPFLFFLLLPFLSFLLFFLFFFLFLFSSSSLSFSSPPPLSSSCSSFSSSSFYFIFYSYRSSLALSLPFLCCWKSCL